MENFIGKRIKEEREKLGFSQQELASKMGWKSHSTVVSIENGEKEVKAWELIKLAQIFNISPQELMTESVKSTDLVLWRQAPAPDAEKILNERLVDQRIKDYRLLMELVPDYGDPLRLLPSEPLDLKMADFIWATQLAEKVYRDFQLGDFPAEILPKRLEEDYGVLLLALSLSKGSAACWRDRESTIIVLNQNEVPWRQIFSLGHELFHLITWSPQLLKAIQKDPKLFQKNEQLAEIFSAALLMPTQMLQLELSQIKGQISYAWIVALSRKYGVSTSAVLWRLHSLRFLPKEKVEEVLKDPSFINLDRTTERKSGEKALGLDHRFVRMAYIAFEKGLISKTRLARMFHVHLPDVDIFLRDKGLMLTDDKKIDLTIT